MIKFTYHYTNKNDSDDIKLIVRNLSRVNTYYYSIAVEGLTDTGWIGLNADINSLGQNDFWVLKPIEPEVL